MRNALAVLLILAVAVGWFSIYGPGEAVDGSGIGPGDDRVGESPLVVSGPGAGIVAVAQANGRAEASAAQELEEAQGRGGETDDRQEPGEGIAMDWTSVALFLAGAFVMLAGFVASPVVAWGWKRAAKS